ncbi:putative RNA-directed DNA polymerase [Helianthus annuus]|nr:putative RNA-directed DNA polymerase [Helianthus annuus]KAJ0686632.1 putative RNA-directed DNA polymerase [Helianthus annuus]
MVNTQFERHIKRVRCDNGGEFTSNDMTNFYNDRGILLETTCPHTPQQNGVAERKHRHILETARSLRFEANLPKRFWGECILTATHIINRLPSKVINGKTPFELVFDRKPDYDNMRVFGCLAYYRNTDTKGDKFEERGRPGVFLGYPPRTKGYKILDIQTGKIIISRDTKFFEENFPFKNDDLIYEEVDALDPLNKPICDEVKINVKPIVDEIHINESTSNEESDGNNETNEPSGTNAINEPNIGSNENEAVDILGQVSDPPDARDNEAQPDILEPIRAKRNRSQPARLSDYHVKLPPSVDHANPAPNEASSTVHPLSNFVSYENFSKSHKAFLAAITSSSEPRNFNQAIQDERWKEAMKKEIRALEENNTWTLVDLPNGKRAVDSKWVYKIKYKPNGEVERFKARLVAKGFTQMEGVDYHDTFAPVAKLVTVRTLLAVAVKKRWVINQLDVNNAFLHGDLNEEVYMKLPQGFAKENDTRVCRLNKSLYGLKQASRNWYQKFTSSLLELGYKQCKADYSLFIFKEDACFVAALIYVDDVIIVGNDARKIQHTKVELDRRFSIKDLGTLKYFLGIEVARTPEGLVLSQRKYILDILEDCGLQGCKPSPFPFEQNLKLDKNDEEPKVDASRYRRLVGRLLYLQATRPDIAYSVNVLSQFVADPRQSHMDAAHRVLRRSRTGYLLLLGGAPISWKTKKQNVVSRSSAEAEYRSMASTVSEILWMRWLLKELNIYTIEPTPLFCDNQAARHIANNPVFHERTKHVEMDCYFVRERVESQEVQPLRIDTSMQIADLLTKGLGTQQLTFLLDKLGVRNLHAPT